MYKLWRKRIPMIALWCPAWLTFSYLKYNSLLVIMLNIYVEYLVVLLKISCRNLQIHCRQNSYQFQLLRKLQAAVFSLVCRNCRYPNTEHYLKFQHKIQSSYSSTCTCTCACACVCVHVHVPNMQNIHTVYMYMYMCAIYLFMHLSTCIYLQFFIAADLKTPEERLWHSKYSIRVNMLPKFISEEVAQKVKKICVHISNNITLLHVFN